MAANKAFLQLRSINHRLGIEIGDTVFLHSSNEAIEKWRALYDRALGGEVVFLEDIKVINGKEYYYEISITPVYDDGDKDFIACVAIAKDVSARWKAEQAISAYGNRFRNFTFKTTHELRSPLANIMALADLGRDENVSFQELKDLFEMVDQSARQLDFIVTELIMLISKENR
jgi:signal transduction histidine kinase